MNDNDQTDDFIADVHIDRVLSDDTPEIRLEQNIKREMPQLPDEFYITALNDEGVERQSRQSKKTLKDS